MSPLKGRRSFAAVTMEIIYLLIPATLLLAGGALAMFLWAVHSGQFDDLDTPPVRILLDEDQPASRAQPPDTP